jgi:glycosyltransferase involved in cell wall biosynthesis
MCSGIDRRAPCSARDAINGWTIVMAVNAVADDTNPEHGAFGESERRRLADLLREDVCQRLGIYEIPANFRLSVVTPVYNEAATLATVVARILQQPLAIELILVNDGSTDGSGAEIARLAEEHACIVPIQFPANQGKGAAVRAGLQVAKGDVVLIQDADLEYDPADYRLLLQPILEDRADVVYGSRFTSPSRPVARYWHHTGNRLITLLSNITTNLKLTDVETCYKVMRRGLVQTVAPQLIEKGFGVEIELTARLARIPGVRFYERPISYHPRSIAAGKKIRWHDGLRALWCILRYH